jgi:hypothetical protein
MRICASLAPCQPPKSLRHLATLIYFHLLTADDAESQNWNGEDFSPILFPGIPRILRFPLLLVAGFSGDLLPRISQVSRMEDPTKLTAEI